MLKKEDVFVGSRFGRLVIMEEIGTAKHGGKVWKCQCDCGNIKETTTDLLKRQKVVSCGCRRKYLRENGTTHGLSARTGMTKEETRFYRIWKSMTKRCRGTGTVEDKYYVDKGIIVSEEWKIFLNFYNDMHGSYSQHVKEHGVVNTSIDRINVDGNYCKENCRWATMKIQANNRSNNILIEHNGETKTLSEWAEQYNREYSIAQSQYKKSHNFEKSFIDEVSTSKRCKCLTTGEIFESLKQASENKIIDIASLSNACNKKQKYAGVGEDGKRLQWTYVNKNGEDIIEEPEHELEISEKSCQCIENGKIYKSISMASKDLNIGFHSISNCLNGWCKRCKSKTDGNFYTFKFVE